MQQNDKLSNVAVMILLALIVTIVLWIIAIIGAMDLTDGCLYRYNFENGKAVSKFDAVSKTVIVNGNGNYSLTTNDEVSGLIQDESSYGKWINANLSVGSKETVKFMIKGEVSLCKAYLPINNLQSDSDKDVNGNLVPVPRVEDHTTPPMTLFFSAKDNRWRNLTQVFKGDQVLVSLMPDQKTTQESTKIFNSIQQNDITADCREGSSTYDPICGRYSIWGPATNYVSSCQFVSNCSKSCVTKCSVAVNIFGLCAFGKEITTCNDIACFKDVKGIAPEPYRNDGHFTMPRTETLSALTPNFAPSCSTNQVFVDGPYQNQKYFWFSADDASALFYRFDSNVNPTSAQNLGTNFEFAKLMQLTELSTVVKNFINSDAAIGNVSANGNIIMDSTFTSQNVAYLQYKLHDHDAKALDHTGGYVLNLKQTKCKHFNGNASNDVIEGRGLVEYVITDFGVDPNSTPPTTTNKMLANIDGQGQFITPDNTDGYLWLRIKNDQQDYVDSIGQYNVQFFTSLPKGGFYDDVLDPFFEGLKTKIQDTAQTVFKNMTCYQSINGSDNCISFFQYIKAMLIIYIILYGMMFLLGMVSISQTDLVIRVIKIGLVAGLMNGSTFEFFNTYVFNFVTGFSDDIISNMAGYSTFSSSNTVSNPFMFLNEVMTKIFFSPVFAGQMMALFAMGLNGVLYFIIIFVCMGIVIIVALRAIAVYLLAFVALAILIGLAPLFLTFILFERTMYLFDNWVKFTFRYMVEPVIMLAGIIILTQLFTIFLDLAIGYSVCWKCAIPFKLPTIQIPGMTPAFLDIEIFCINWFAPWGFDHRSGQMGLNMQNLIILLMLAYCMWQYIDFASSITTKLVGGAGGPSATGMGNSMSGAIGQSALKKIGLDQQSRSAIRRGIQDRAKSMRDGAKHGGLSSDGRKDAPDSGVPGGSEGGKGSGGGGEKGSGGGGAPGSGGSGVDRGGSSGGVPVAKLVEGQNPNAPKAIKFATPVEGQNPNAPKAIPVAKLVKPSEQNGVQAKAIPFAKRVSPADVQAPEGPQVPMDPKAQEALENQVQRDEAVNKKVDAIAKAAEQRQQEQAANVQKQVDEIMGAVKKVEPEEPKAEQVEQNPQSIVGKPNKPNKPDEVD
jgi:type IV secretion system protein VirB6